MLFLCKKSGVYVFSVEPKRRPCLMLQDWISTPPLLLWRRGLGEEAVLSFFCMRLHIELKHRANGLLSLNPSPPQEERETSQQHRMNLAFAQKNAPGTVRALAGKDACATGGSRCLVDFRRDLFVQFKPIMLNRAGNFHQGFKTDWFDQV